MKEVIVIFVFLRVRVCHSLCYKDASSLACVQCHDSREWIMDKDQRHSETARSCSRLFFISPSCFLPIDYSSGPRLTLLL